MFRKLLVPLDRSALAEQALGPAAAIARASHAEMDLVLVHQPVPFVGFADVPWNAAQAMEEDKYLESIAGELVSGGSVSATHAVLRGDVIETICARAHDVGADLIVMTSHGRTGFSRAWVGSVADGVLRQSAIPVLVMRPVETEMDRMAAHHLFKRILVPLDGSALATEILSSAAAVAHCSKARLVLIRVVQPVPLFTPEAGMAFVYPPVIQDDEATRFVAEEAKQDLAETAYTLALQGGTDVETHVIIASNVPRAIIDFAADHGVDAIAMSTHGRGVSRLFVGSVADKLLRASGVPILLKRPVRVSERLHLDSSTSVLEELPALVF
jgi:nucleotide-binding universal stress UspA family protein